MTKHTEEPVKTLKKNIQLDDLEKVSGGSDVRERGREPSTNRIVPRGRFVPRR